MGYQNIKSRNLLKTLINKGFKAPAKECRLRDLNPHGVATNGF